MNSNTSTACALCGGPLDDHDLDRGTCHDCRSPEGRIANLDIAIRASGDDPKRISDWPVIRHMLQKRFGQDRSDAELWEQCTGWFQAEGVEPNYYLWLPIEALTGLLRTGFRAGYEAELDQLMQQHKRDRSAHRAKVLEHNPNQGKLLKELPFGSSPETPISPTNEAQNLTQLDQFPDTPAGHVSFVEMVRGEIHFAADGKRNQFAEKYSNDTIACMVRGGVSLMAEAARRIATLSELPTEVVEQVACVMRRELTPGTVEYIDELLTPTVRALRDAWEDRDAPSKPTASGDNDVIDRLLSGPDDAELSPREFAFLEAYLKQQVWLPQIQRETQAVGKSDTAQGMNKLKLIRDFNRNLQTSRETRQSKTKRAVENQQVIESIHLETPKLETESVEWLAARKENEKKLGLPLATLRNYRAPSKGGRKMPDAMFGIDRDRRRWRRQGTPNSTVYYFVPSLPKR